MSTHLGVVVLARISKRHAAAVAATRNGHTLTPHEMGVLLAEMKRLIDAHDDALVRIRQAQVALDPALRARP